jgi:hypothetical protein
MDDRHAARRHPAAPPAVVAAAAGVSLSLSSSRRIAAPPRPHAGRHPHHHRRSLVRAADGDGGDRLHQHRQQRAVRGARRDVRGAHPVRAAVAPERARPGGRADGPRRGVRQPPLRGRLPPREPRLAAAALVPAAAPDARGEAAADPLPAAARAQQRPHRDHGAAARSLPRAACARLEPLPVRLLPQRRALSQRPGRAGLPGDLPGRRPPLRRGRGDGRGSQPAARLGARAVLAARLPPRRRPARHPLEADGADRRDRLHGEGGRAGAPPVDPVRQRRRRAGGRRAA